VAAEIFRRSISLADYKKLYYKLFNAATDVDILVAQAGRLIRTAQQECEEMYIEADDMPIEFAGKGARRVRF
jgi:hypothetical protein